MKIPVKHLKEDEGHIFEDDLKPEDLDLDIGVMHFPNDLHVHAEVWKSGDDLTVNVKLDGERAFTCSLCLEEFNNLFEKDLTLHYDIKGLDSVTLDPEIRDEVILDHPIRVLCKPECKGLCHQCGANLNDGPCKCQTKPGKIDH